jgi:hypothetical protein
VGYRGLVLKIVYGASHFINWRVFRTCLQHDGQVFNDAQASVEAFLLRSMPPRLKTHLAGALPSIGRW